MDSWIAILIGVVAIVMSIKANKEKENKGNARRINFPPSDTAEDFDNTAEEIRDIFRKYVPIKDIVEEPEVKIVEHFEPKKANRVVEGVPTTHVDINDLTRPYQAPVKKSDRFKIDPEKMIVFSAILQPKFEEN